MEGKMLNNPNITKTHFGIYGILKQNGKILLIKKARGPYTGLYDLPGGSPETGETKEETLKRELMEETSLKVKKYALLKELRVIFSDFTRASGEKGTLAHTGVLFDVADWEGDILTTSDGLDSLGAQWVDIDTLNGQNATPFALIGAEKEVIHLADENDHIISTHVRGEKPLQKGRYAMISAVLVYNSKGEVLLHKIAPHKKWGGMWTYSAAGHVDAGEGYQEAVKRELFEELQIKADCFEEVASLTTVEMGQKCAYHHVFKVTTDAVPNPDKNEISEIRWFKKEELKALAGMDKMAFHPKMYELIVKDKI